MQANLTAAHKGNLREKFRRRKISLFRKADQRAHIGDAVVYVHIVRNDSCYTYNSTKEEFLPRAFIERRFPQHFIIPASAGSDAESLHQEEAVEADNLWTIPSSVAPITESGYVPEMLPETAVESSVYMLNNTSEESAQPRLDDRPPVGSFDIGSLEDMTWVFQPETVGLAGGYGCSGEKPQHQAASQDSHAKKAPAVKLLPLLSINDLYVSNSCEFLEVTYPWVYLNMQQLAHGTSGSSVSSLDVHHGGDAGTSPEVPTGGPLLKYRSDLQALADSQ
ncbi:hypothetical protein MMC21_007883 [Puttea exsequens]|nr:hypothetical protein [Puttea exsequens]